MNSRTNAIISLIKDARECIHRHDEQEGNSDLLDEAVSSLDAALLGLDDLERSS